MSLPDAIDWERQRAFLAVMTQGSLSAAARALGIAQPTVRRRIEELEAQTGAALFTRTPSGLLPTDRAQGLVDQARAMALAADAFARAASADAHEIAGRVRITASDVIAIEILPPILAALGARHPQLVLELSPSNRQEDVLRREADVAVRMARPVQEALVAQRIGAVVVGLHAHPAYLASAGTPETLGDLRHHRMIGVVQDDPMLRVLQSKGLPLHRDSAQFRSDSHLAHLAAIRAGIGIGICQTGIARRDGLVRLVPEAFGHDLDTWVVCHEDLRGVARVRATFDALVTGLRDYVSG